MQQKKRGFWLFIFSLIPGAGELYMGFRKQGTSIMALCWGLIALSGLSGSAVFACILPVLWFYSFFNVHNLKSLPDEEFYSLEDHYIFNIDLQEIMPGNFILKYRKILAALLILFGFSILWSSCTDILYALLPSGAYEIIYVISRKLPTIVIACIIITLGFYLFSEKVNKIASHKESADESEHYWEPYRPYQQPSVPSLKKTEEATSPEPASSLTEETDSTENSIP